MRARLRGASIGRALPWALVAAAVVALALPTLLGFPLVGREPSDAPARIRAILLGAYVVAGLLVATAVALSASQGRRQSRPALRHAAALLFVGIMLSGAFAHPAHDARSADWIRGHYLEEDGLRFQGAYLTDLRHIQGMPEHPFQGKVVLGADTGGQPEPEAPPSLTVPARRGDLWLVHASMSGASSDGMPTLRVSPAGACELQHEENHLVQPDRPYRAAIWQCIALVDGPAILHLETEPGDAASSYHLAMRTYPTEAALAASLDEALVHLGAGLAFGGLFLMLLLAGRVPASGRHRAEAVAALGLASMTLAWPLFAWIAGRAGGHPHDADAFVQFIAGAWRNLTLLATVLLGIAVIRGWSGREPEAARRLACYGAIFATVSLLCGAFIVLARDTGSLFGGIAFGILGFLAAAVAAVRWASTPECAEDGA